MDSGLGDDFFYRVAFASSDGYVVDTHFGRAETLYIYQFFDGEYSLVEKRYVSSVCQGGTHSPNEMRKNVEHFLDCQYIVALRIGVGAMAIIRECGITPMVLPGELTEAMDKIYKYHQIQKLFK